MQRGVKIRRYSCCSTLVKSWIGLSTFKVKITVLSKTVVTKFRLKKAACALTYQCQASVIVQQWHLHDQRTTAAIQNHTTHSSRNNKNVITQITDVPTICATCNGGLNDSRRSKVALQSPYFFWEDIIDCSRQQKFLMRTGTGIA